MSALIPNTSLLRKTLEKITANREGWYQGSWATLLGDSAFTERIDRDFAKGLDSGRRLESTPATVEETGCGTALCLAGQTLADAGVTLLWRGRTASYCVDPETGGEAGIHVVAARMLGLTVDQSGALFAGSNSLPMLWAVAEIITGGEIELPPAEVVGESPFAERGEYEWVNRSAAELRASARSRLLMNSTT